MVRDGGLGAPERVDQVARAGFAVSRGGDHRQEAEAGRVGEDLEHVGEVGGVVLVEGAVAAADAAARW